MFAALVVPSIYIVTLCLVLVLLHLILDNIQEKLKLEIWLLKLSNS